jgi:hypothetical protein
MLMSLGFLSLIAFNLTLVVEGSSRTEKSLDRTNQGRLFVSGLQNVLLRGDLCTQALAGNIVPASLSDPPEGMTFTDPSTGEVISSPYTISSDPLIELETLQFHSRVADLSTNSVGTNAIFKIRARVERAHMSQGNPKFDEFEFFLSVYHDNSNQIVGCEQTTLDCVLGARNNTAGPEPDWYYNSLNISDSNISQEPATLKVDSGDLEMLDGSVYVDIPGSVYSNLVTGSDSPVKTLNNLGQEVEVCFGDVNGNPVGCPPLPDPPPPANNPGMHPITFDHSEYQSQCTQAYFGEWDEIGFNNNSDPLCTFSYTCPAGKYVVGFKLPFSTRTTHHLEQSSAGQTYCQLNTMDQMCNAKMGVRPGRSKEALRRVEVTENSITVRAETTTDCNKFRAAANHELRYGTSNQAQQGSGMYSLHNRLRVQCCPLY